MVVHGRVQHGRGTLENGVRLPEGREVTVLAHGTVPPAAQTKGTWSHSVLDFSLGRKRLLDTLLAATYWQAGIQSVLTTNQSDLRVFGVFACATPQGKRRESLNCVGRGDRGSEKGTSLTSTV